MRSKGNASIGQALHAEKGTRNRDQRSARHEGYGLSPRMRAEPTPNKDYKPRITMKGTGFIPYINRSKGTGL